MCPVNYPYNFVQYAPLSPGKKIAPKVLFSLEESMEYIKEDEYLEITPESLRMRKIKL